MAKSSRLRARGISRSQLFFESAASKRPISRGENTVTTAIVQTAESMIDRSATVANVYEFGASPWGCICRQSPLCELNHVVVYLDHCAL